MTKNVELLEISMVIFIFVLFFFPQTNRDSFACKKFCEKKKDVHGIYTSIKHLLTTNNNDKNLKNLNLISLYL